MAGEAGFNEKEVSWQQGEFTMEATVTWPDGTGVYPGIVMVAGSGPTDRNWCSPLIPGSNGSASILAERLTRAGYATIRYDKVASGPHLQENAEKLAGKISMKSHFEEVQSAFRSLVENTGADRNRVFALTNSEGAIHAMTCQLMGSGDKFCGMILTGVPARPLKEIAREQIVGQLSRTPGADNLIEYYDTSIRKFEDGEEFTPDESMPESLNMFLASMSSPVNQPFSREMWLLDPVDLLSMVEVPMLLMIGKKDIQVSWERDGKILSEKLSSRNNVSIRFPDNADHVLKHEETPADEIVAGEAGMNYNSEGREIDGETVETILDWLNSTNGV